MSSSHHTGFSGTWRHSGSARVLVAHAWMHGHAKYAFRKGAKYRTAYYGGMQCVPFARAASGIELKGNAANWWDAAAGVYERGSRPEAGSVLNFRANGRMRLGHVSVVTAVLNSREIEVEHANWPGFGRSKNGVSMDVPVEDVSPENDWTEVRVAIGGGDFGSVYRTYGFIYDQPDTGVMLANDHGAGTQVATRDAAYTEVAEAPPPAAKAVRRRAPVRLILDAPSRNLQ